MTGRLEGDLDAYSRLAVSAVLARFPEWEGFARLTPRPDGAGSVVEFDVPCPSPAAAYGLLLSTAGAELTVGFHTHHDHYTNYDNPLDPGPIEDGVRRAADYVGERVGVACWYRGATCVGSMAVALPLEGPLHGLEPVFRACDRATLLSWRGRFDREERRG